MPNPQEQSNAQANPPAKPQVLEEDDEFEDFPVEGRSGSVTPRPTDKLINHPDWPQEEAEPPTDPSETALWDASWEDDEAEQGFSQQLKCVPRVPNALSDLPCNSPLSLQSPSGIEHILPLSFPSPTAIISLLNPSVLTIHLQGGIKESRSVHLIQQYQIRLRDVLTSE